MLVLNIGKKIIVIDNSGVRFAKLISVLRKKKNLDVGNVILVAISKVKKKDE